MLTGTKFYRADLCEALFIDVDLTAAVGLEECNHRGPSTIDQRSIVRSHNLPLGFLRGCGMNQALIDYLPSLVKQAIQFYSCFISYSSKDQKFADRVNADLQNNGVRCWFAPHDIQGGKKLHEQIDEAIRVHERLLLILSEHSITSEWVKTEIFGLGKRECGREARISPFVVVDFERACGVGMLSAYGKDDAGDSRILHP